MKVNVMKRLSMVLVILVAAVSLAAQNEGYSGFLALTAGVSLPAGSFSSSSPDDAEAGYANPGFAASFHAASRIGDWFGVAGTIGYHSLPFDDEALARNFLASRPGYEYEVSSDPYSMVNIVVGPLISVPQGPVDIGVRGLVGMAVCTLPSSSYTYRAGGPGDPYYLVQSMMNRSTALVYGGGINLMVRVAGGLAILADASCLRASPKFNAVEVRVYEYGQLVGLTGIDIEQDFSVFGVLAGLAYTF